MNQLEKYKKNMRCLDKWLSNYEQGRLFADYLNAYQVHRIGIYGYGMLGRHLVRQLQEQGVSIAWVMDRASLEDELNCNLVKPGEADGLEDVDLAIITTLMDVEEAESILMTFVTGEIISIEELVDSISVWGNQS